ncbi:MAG: hypothetical protein IJK60_05645 [Clostridia bacterium]|nr:hypothetical protein [Clostridia bacterium]
MTKYINADKLIKDLRDNAAEHFNSTVNSIIIAQPSADVVEVVRCKDCKYYKCFTKSRYFAPNKACYRQKDNMGNKIGFSKSDNDFCSLGERRENNAEI